MKFLYFLKKYFIMCIYVNLYKVLLKIFWEFFYAQKCIQVHSKVHFVILIHFPSPLFWNLPLNIQKIGVSEVTLQFKENLEQVWTSLLK